MFFGRNRSKAEASGTAIMDRPVTQPSLSQEEKVAARARMVSSNKPIDVRELMHLYTVEELCQTAEDYYSGSTDWSGLLSKPYVCVQETPELLICFAQLLQGILPVGGMDVLDFGAGPGWASHALTQLGAKVIVSDVSATALKITAARFERWPIQTPHTPPRYTHFNGRTFDLPDASLDRIVCIDAFHHIPNPQEVLCEMGRILRDGGIAAFAEPGPKHSWSPGAQYEMKHHHVVENDVIIEDIWKMAKKAGFGDIRLSVFGTSPFQVSLDEFNDFLQGGHVANQALQGIQHYMTNSRRLFFLIKGGERPKDSRSPEGLGGVLEVRTTQRRVKAGERIKLECKAMNTGKLNWLQASKSFGSVWFGMSTISRGDGLSEPGSFASPLPLEETNGLLPGKSINFQIELDAPAAPGNYTMEFDLVAQQVAWFQNCGSQTVKINVEVTA